MMQKEVFEIIRNHTPIDPFKRFMQESIPDARKIKTNFGE